MRSLVIPTTTLVSLFLLAGCAAPNPDPSPTASPTPTPTVSPVSMEPTPRFDLSCENLFTPAEYASAAPIDPPATPVDVDLKPYGIPGALYIVADGGLHCVWSNSTDPMAPFAVVIDVLPAANAAWTARVAESGEPPATLCGWAACWFEKLVGDYWVSAVIHDSSIPEGEVAVGEHPAIADVFTRLESAVSALGAPAPAWEPPVATTLPLSCDALLSPSEVGTAIGLDNIVLIEQQDRRTSMDTAARNAVGGLACGWDNGGPSSVAVVQTLQGGAWLQDAYLSQDPVPDYAPPTALALDGVASPNAAYERCGPGGCFIDLFFGGNWVFVSGPDDIPLALATALLAKLDG